MGASAGRYETILWFTKTDDYIFNLDSEFSYNPLGKNPSDIWAIPNVKDNHVEKTIHPYQFPIELLERFILALTNKNDLVFGVRLTSAVAVKNNRRGMGYEIIEEYYTAVGAGRGWPRGQSPRRRRRPSGQTAPASRPGASARPVSAHRQSPAPISPLAAPPETPGSTGLRRPQARGSRRSRE
jgi:hypothetical protein